MKRMASDEIDRLNGLKRIRVTVNVTDSQAFNLRTGNRQRERDSLGIDPDSIHARLHGKRTRSSSAKRRDPRDRINNMHNGGGEDDSQNDERRLTEEEARELVARLTERNSHRPNCRCYACEMGAAVSHIKSMKVKKPRRSYSKSKSRSRSRSRSGSMRG